MTLKKRGDPKMNMLKEATIESIKRLPDECSLEDIMYRINFVAQVLEGLQDAQSGKLLTTEEVLERVEQWAK
jgi:predicted transcriptional regulator